jgi:hypothetical protein
MLVLLALPEQVPLPRSAGLSMARRPARRPLSLALSVPAAGHQNSPALLLHSAAAAASLPVASSLARP